MWIAMFAMGCGTPEAPIRVETDADTDTDTDADTDVDVDTDADADPWTPPTWDPHATVTQVVVVPPPAPSACEGVGAFTDVSACVGVTDWHAMGPIAPDLWYVTGQGWADLDGDGRLDLVTTSADATRVYLGRAGGVFEARAEPALEGMSGGPLALADVDGDGAPDLYVGGQQQGWLLHNDGGSFSLVPQGPSNRGLAHGVSFGDLDQDGSPELYVSHYSCLGCPIPAPWSGTDQLFAQQGSRWWDRSEWLGSPSLLNGLGFLGSFADYDGDGDVDLYVLNDRGSPGPDPEDAPILRNVYFRNDGVGCEGVCMVETAVQSGLDGRMDAMGLAAEDIDRDGDLDVLVTDTAAPTLFRNGGTAGFQAEFNTNGLQTWRTTWGVAWFDIDNDGDLDALLAASQSDVLYRNDDGVFTDITEGSGAEDTAHTAGLSVADYDGDGRVDVVLGDLGIGYRILRNTHESANSWIGIRLRNNRSAGGTSALGARVWVTDSEGRTQMREVQSGTSLGGGSDLGLHFGLGSASLVEVRVRWPDGAEEWIEPMVSHWNLVVRPAVP